MTAPIRPTKKKHQPPSRTMQEENEGSYDAAMDEGLSYDAMPHRRPLTVPPMALPDATAVRPPGSSPGGDAAAIVDAVADLPTKYAEHSRADADAFDAAGGPAGQFQRVGDRAQHAAEAIAQGVRDLTDAVTRRAARRRTP